MGRRVKILALLPGAAALDVVHANSDGVISGVNHWTVAGVGKAAIRFPSRAASPLKLAAHLWREIIKTGTEESFNRGSCPPTEVPGFL